MDRRAFIQKFEEQGSKGYSSYIASEDHKFTLVLIHHCGGMIFHSYPGLLYRLFKSPVGPTIKFVWFWLPCRKALRHYEYSSGSEGELVVDDAEFLESMANIQDVCRNEVALVGNPSRVGVLGYSQGADMALHLAISCPAPLGFVVALRGGLFDAFPRGPPPPAPRQIPTLLSLADKDEAYDKDTQKRTVSKLRSYGVPLQVIRLQNVGHHGVSAKEHEDVMTFIGARWRAARPDRKATAVARGRKARSKPQSARRTPKASARKTSGKKGKR